MRDLVRDRFNIQLPFIPIGLDPSSYGPYNGGDGRILTIIHSWKDRGWHYPLYLEATKDLPTLHIDALNDKPPARYESLLATLRDCRLYFHDGEADYTIALAEAMLAGQPIVSPDLPYLDRYIHDGVNGFRSNNPAILRDRCRLLLADAPLAKAMGQKSRNIALTYFQEDRWNQAWKGIVAAIRERRWRSG